MTYNWNHNRTAIEGVAHLLSRIEEGRQILRKNVLEGHAQVPNVPGVTADKTFEDAGLPLVGDKCESSPSSFAIDSLTYLFV